MYMTRCSPLRKTGDREVYGVLAGAAGVSWHVDCNDCVRSCKMF